MPSDLAENSMSPLESILSLFASHEDVSWDAFAGLHGMVWRDTQASAIEFENPRTLALNNSHVRNGNLLLLGFGLVDMPDGQYGCESALVVRNEGYSSLALIGDARYVHWIVVQKFYPSDLESLMQAQWSDAEPANRPRLHKQQTENQASTENTASSTWSIVFNQMPAMCVDFFVDVLGTRYSPGTTTLVFHKPK